MEPPHCWPFFEGRPNLAFDYTCIKLWEMERSELLDLKQPALLPLALLTKGGANRIMIRDMFRELMSSRLHDLLPVGQTIASWLLKGVDLEWLKREYLTLLDLFKDSPAYQWMTESAREEERTNTLASLRQIVITLVHERFPQLTAQARQQIQTLNDQECLQQAILRVGLSKDATEVANALTTLSAETEK